MRWLLKLTLKIQDNKKPPSPKDGGFQVFTPNIQLVNESNRLFKESNRLVKNPRLTAHHLKQIRRASQPFR